MPRPTGAGPTAGAIPVTKLKANGAASAVPARFRTPVEIVTLWLVVRGDRASYYVNGHLVNEVTQLKQWNDAAKEWQPLTKGRILLQAEGAEIFYRNVTLQPLPPS